MRILLCTADAGGNVPPLVSIAAELVRRGHTVRVLGGPYLPGPPRTEALQASFSAAGCEVVSPEAAVWLDGAGPMPDITAIPAHFQMLRTMAICTPIAEPWAVQTAREIETFRPALVITDFITPSAAAAAEAAGIPYVFPQTTVPVHRLLPGLPVPGMGTPPGEDEQAQRDEFRRIANETSLPWLNAARTRLGLSPDADPWAWEDRAERVLILSSPAFDLRADSYPANYVYTGSVRPAEFSGEWDNPWDSGDERPLVVVSTTTTGLAGMWYSVFQAATKAIVELGMRGLMTVGPLDSNALPQDESLAYRSFVPHSAVLPAAAAMVSQCGHGAAIAALRHGVPLVCVPVFADQYDIAARVVHHGAGVTLSTMSTAEEFRYAIEAVVRDQKYRDAARALAEKLATEDGTQRAADEIESVAGPP